MSTALFIPKAKYRVTQDFTDDTSNFVKGEILTFDVGGYSRYDECYFYNFHDELGNRKDAALDALRPSGCEPIGSPEAENLLKLFELLP